MQAKQNSHPTSSLVQTQLKDIEKQLPLRVLSRDDWHHWTTNGYVIVRQAVPAANVERLVDLLWTFDEKDPDDPSTWHAPQRREHRMKELNNTGMLEIYNHQYLWDNRQERRVYDAFVDIWDREDLWVTIDRANLNPPKKAQGQPERLHPLGRRHLAAAAADRRPGRAQPEEAGRRRRRLPVHSQDCSTASRNGSGRSRPTATRCIPTSRGSRSSMSRWRRATC